LRALLPEPVERRVSRVYRRFYVDLDDLGRTLSRLGPFDSVLEVGCGDGAVTNVLAAAFPETRIMGIDVVANPGAAYAGDRSRVTMAQMTTAELADAHGAGFSLVVVCDVLHHVPVAERADFLRSCRTLIAPGGVFVVKEWEQRRNSPGALAYLSDRHVTGDRQVRFWTRDQLLAAVAQACPDLAIGLELRVPPWRNNLLVGFRAPSSDS
jgi:2-polyprenyl-6-hydroxyphenyl methylase/3-demethylubiquinone-9 3-methyltransferase